MYKAKVEAICSECQSNVALRSQALRDNIKRNGRYICQRCTFKSRPQCTKEFWSQKPDSIQKIKDALATSEKFKVSRKVVSEKLSGAGNPMYGKSASDETKAKMSASRRGKFGDKATAWKGGKQSLNLQVKRAIYRRHRWAEKVLTEAGRKCQHCSSKKNLEAHHVIPFAKALKDLLLFAPNLDRESLLEWLIDHPTLAKAEGIAVCRQCHKKIHSNWGSHYPETQWHPSTKTALEQGSSNTKP